MLGSFSIWSKKGGMESGVYLPMGEEIKGVGDWGYFDGYPEGSILPWG
jgi:hypothetical protein